MANTIKTHARRYEVGDLIKIDSTKDTVAAYIEADHDKNTGDREIWRTIRSVHTTQDGTLLNVTVNLGYHDYVVLEHEIVDFIKSFYCRRSRSLLGFDLERRTP